MNIFLSNIPCEQCQNLYDKALPITSECYKSFAIYCEQNHPDTVCESCYGSPGPPNPHECSLAMSNAYQAACGAWFENHSQVKIPDGNISFLSVLASVGVFTACICCCLYYYWNQEQRNRRADEFINQHHSILLDDQQSTWQQESMTPGMDFGNQEEGNTTSFKRYIGEGKGKRTSAVAGKLYGNGVGKGKNGSPRVREILQRHRQKQIKVKRNRHPFQREYQHNNPLPRQTSVISDSTIAFLEEDTPRAVNQNAYNMASIFDRDLPNLPLENSQPISDSTVDFLLEAPSPRMSKKKQPLSQVAEHAISTNTIAFLTSDLSTLKSSSKVTPSFGYVDYVTPGGVYPVGANPGSSPLEHTGENESKNVKFVDRESIVNILQDDDDAETSALQLEGGTDDATQGDKGSNLEVEDQPDKSISPKSNPRINSRINLMFEDRESEEETHLVTYVTPRGGHHEVNYYAPHRSADTEETLIVSISRNCARTKPLETTSKDVVYSPINFAKKNKTLRSAPRTSKKRSRSPSDVRQNVSNSTESIRKKRRSDSYAVKRDASHGGGMISDTRSDAALSSGGSVVSIPISIGGAPVPSSFAPKRSTPKSKRNDKSYDIPRPGHGKHLSSSYSAPDSGIHKRRPQSGASSSSIYNKEKKHEDQNESRHVLYDSNISEKQNDKDSHGGASGGVQNFGNLPERAMYMTGRDEYFPEKPNGIRNYMIGLFSDKSKQKTFSSDACTDISFGGSAVTGGTAMSYAHLLGHFSKDEPLELLEADGDTDDTHSYHSPNTQSNRSNGTSYSNLVKRFFSSHDDAGPGRLQTYFDGRESSHSNPATDTVMAKQFSDPPSDVWEAKETAPKHNPDDFRHLQDGSSDVFAPSEKVPPTRNISRNIYQMFLDEPEPGPHGTKFPSFLDPLESNMEDSDPYISTNDRHRDENGHIIGVGDITTLFGRIDDISASYSHDEYAADDSAHSLPTSLRSSRVGRNMNEGENNSFGFDNDNTDNAHE